MSTENYLFRRNICAIPTNALNKIFSLLHREIVRYDGSETDCVEKSKYALLCKKEKARFPDDDEFALRSTERQVYQMNSKNKVYILERLEDHATAFCTMLTLQIWYSISAMKMKMLRMKLVQDMSFAENTGDTL